MRSLKSRSRFLSLFLLLALTFSVLGVMPVGAVINASSFAPGVAFAVGSRPIDAAIGDIDGDGKPDLLVANEQGVSVSVLRNTSTPGTIDAGSFAPSVTFPALAGQTRCVAVGDLDGDGKLDMAASNYNGFYVSVWRNTSTPGTISFAARQDFAATRYNNWVMFADIDGDGKQDMVVSSLTTDGLYVFQNTSTVGNISFAASVFFATSNDPWIFTIGDVDGDGKPDLAVSNQLGNTVSVLRNTSTAGTISFAAAFNIAMGAAPYGIATGDLDGDGKADLVVLDNTYALSAYLNTGSPGTISFAAPVTYASGSGDWDVHIGDVDVDGKPDLVFTSGLAVLPNTSTPGTISFAPAVVFGGGSRPGAMGDLDGDGRLDMAIPNWLSATVSVYRNTTPTVVTIDGITPNPTNAGTTITWHADRNGHFSVRVGGSDCATGTEVDSGTYSTSPATVNSTIPSGNLVAGSNTLRVCVTDALGNTGFVTGTVQKDVIDPTVTVDQAAGQADPTNVTPIRFTAVFNEPINTATFTTADVSLSGTAPGATVASVTEIAPNDGTTFQISVSGMTGSGTVIASIPAGGVQDLAGNANAASTSTDNTVTYDTTAPALTSFTRFDPPASPTSADTLTFRAAFSKDVQNVDAADFSINAAPATTAAITAVTPVSASLYEITVSGGDLAAYNGVIGLDLAAGQNITDLANNPLPAGEPAVDETYTVDNSAPLVASLNLQVNYVGPGPASFTVQFNMPVADPPGHTDPDDVTNPANYLLIEKGPNGVTDTLSCLAGVSGDDVQQTVTSVAYDSITYGSTVTLAGALPVGNYRLFLCGTTSIVSLAGVPLNNGADYTFDFVVRASAAGGALPATGFPMGRITSLAAQPAEKAYTTYDELMLEIPSLGVKAPIVGVWNSDADWDVSWLGNSVGWLEGSAFPTWPGNTVLTGHVWNADNTPGVFAQIKTLKYGDRFSIHAFGQTYVYEVRENTWLWGNSSSLKVFRHEEYDWVTLLTCEGYNRLTGEYLFRRMVRAVLVQVK